MYVEMQSSECGRKVRKMCRTVHSSHPGVIASVGEALMISCRPYDTRSASHSFIQRIIRSTVERATLAPAGKRAPMSVSAYRFSKNGPGYLHVFAVYKSRL